MKSKRRKRVIASVLCMVLMLSMGMSTLAEADAGTVPAVEETAAARTTAQETESTSTDVQTAETETQPQTETENQTETKQTEEAAQTKQEETTAVQPTEEASGGETTQTETDQTAQNTQDQTTSAETSGTETQNETVETQTEETETTTKKEETQETKEEAKVSPAFSETYENSEVTVKVTAEEGIVPEGAKLSVTPIVKKEITDQMSEEEKAEAKKINDQYDLTEKKLSEDSDKNKEIMEGFLAYDISFLVDGKEVEPSGDVKVVIDFKKAAVPEGVSEDAAVAVKHLKEDPTAEDGVVVENMDEKATVKTTEKAEVEKVEMTADHFSTYTVTWIAGPYRSVKITAHYGYLEKGEFVEFTETPKEKINGNNLTNWKKLEDYANKDQFEVDGAKYAGVYIMKDPGNAFKFTDALEITHLTIRTSRGQYYLYYRNGNNGDGSQWGSSLPSSHTETRNIYYVYDKLTTVDTVDNSQAGIKMIMKNYESPANNIDIGGSYGDGDVKQRLLNRVLTNGYPVTNQGGGRSLKSLFSGKSARTVNHLFLQETYDETGYYEYSSFENYAYLNSNNNFTVYNQLGTPSIHNNDSAFYYNRGNFLPFNNISAGNISGNRNLYGEDGEGLDSSNPRYNEPLYLSDGTDYYFGMYMDVRFLQPKNGQAIHNEKTSDMIYEFNGDDDLWVYIDNVLVLDIGGIHDAHSGYINFANGEVHVEGVNESNPKNVDYDTTIKEMFRKAQVFPDGESWDSEKVDQYFDGDTFRDYTNHNMKMFYMERGAGASNLHMKFNLQTVPEGAIEVTKQLTNTDQDKYANVEFAFQVYAKKIIGYDTDDNEIYSDSDLDSDYVLLKNGAFYGDSENEITFLDNVKIEGSDQEYDGVFYLKPGETAQFRNLQDTRKYYVKELGIKADEYSQVIVDDTTITIKDEDGNENQIKDVETNKDEVYDRPAVVFQNSCSDKNRLELKITKKMKEGQSTEDTFKFLIKLEGTAGNMIPYSGDYYLKDSAGNYWYYDENHTLQNSRTTARVCGTVVNGEVSGVPVGYSVIITQILAGTSFEVKEIDLNENKYGSPEYEISQESVDNPNTDGGASGEMILDKNAEVTVTNSLKQLLQVKKMWIGENSNPTAEIYVGLYQNNCPVAEKYIKLTTPNWTAQFEGIDGSGYSVKELRLVTEGEVAEFSIDGKSYIGINEGDSITIDDNKYEVDYEDPTRDPAIDNQLNCTIKNIQSWQIIKRSSSEGNPPLGGAEFKLSNGDGQFKGTSESGGVVQWKDSSGAPVKIIPDGIYTLEEEKAPQGYIKGQSWTIKIENGFPTSINGKQGEGLLESKVMVGNVNFYKQEGILTLYYDNDTLYELPEAGGPGTFGYTIGGVLLLMAGTLILYKLKKGEVLKK